MIGRFLCRIGILNILCALVALGIVILAYGVVKG